MLKGVEAACPVQAIEATSDTAAANASQRHNAERSKARQIASTMASAKRTCATKPNCVKLSTSRSAPDITASPRPSSLNDIVSNSTQASPETAATASAIQVVARNCLSIGAAAAAPRAKPVPRQSRGKPGRRP